MTAAALRGHVEVLAADRLQGRDTGSVGGLAAAHYIAGVLAAAGCEPAGDDGGWFQKTDVERHELSGPGQLFLVDGDGVEHEMACGTDWLMFAGGPVAGTFDLVSAASEEALPDTGEPDKVLVLTADVRTAYGWVRSGLTDGWAAVLLMGPPMPGEAQPAPAELISRPDAMANIMVRGNSAAGFADGRWQQLRLHLEAQTSSAAYNVLGRLPGVGSADDPTVADEVVVLTAHYDHVTGPALEEGGDAIYNGADDDASGVAAVLELARAAGSQEAGERTLLFLLVTGEEHGLLGTYYYLDHPAAPLEQTVYNLNFEMIGRPDPLVGGPGKLWLTGYELSNVGPAWADQGIEVVADPRPQQSFFQRSDNYAFVERGVVAQSFSSYNMHQDYHRPSDEADRLDYDHMAQSLAVSWAALEMLVSGGFTPAWLEDADLGLTSEGGR
ncbi:MAG: hypothetical protein ACI9EF_000432 [Pseudohongiellaceae bacterium]|jgi:hypothetical protein